jgi:3-isopropylmalate/(R)-2-methylmalate dehydratase small subunit
VSAGAASTLAVSAAAIKGRVWKFGDGISGDDGVIQYSRLTDLSTYDEPALRAMCFELVEPRFVKEVRAGDLVVAGHNFAHHSHPHVSVALKASGIAAVVAESCDSNFLRKSLNVGLPVVPCPGITSLVQAFGELEVDLARGQVRECAGGKALPVRPYSARMLGIVRAGGLIPFLKAEQARAA